MNLSARSPHRQSSSSPLLFACALLFSATPSANAAIWYVNAAAAPGGNGTAWATAFQDLQSAADAASDAGGGEVWAAEGTYTSAADTVLVMREDVDLYGGFTGAETAREQRDWNAHRSIINGDNTRLCVEGSSHATLDGFAVNNGKAPEESNKSGGGMYNRDASPTIKNCVFADNRANEGAAIFCYESDSITIRDCIFVANEADLGGAIMSSCASMTSGSSSITIEGCVFANNAAENGGAIFDSNANSVLTGCIFINNRANRTGGAVANENWFSSPSLSSTISNCVFAGNLSVDGGALWNDEFSLEIVNSVFQGNEARQGGAITHSSAPMSLKNCTMTANTSYTASAIRISGTKTSMILTNCIVWENPVLYGRQIETFSAPPPSITYSCIQGGYEGQGNISSDPRFVDGSGGSVQLRQGSPCIDAGSGLDAPHADLMGRSRPQGNGIDMGAYEGCVADDAIVTLTVQVPREEAEGIVPPAGMHACVRGETVWVSGRNRGSAFFLGWEDHDEAAIPLIMDSDQTVSAICRVNLRYVNVASTASIPDGLSWETAYRDLQTAVDDAAVEGRGEIWAAQGSYTSIREPVLYMKNNVSLYGGFAGIETSRSQRDWSAHPTIIDGRNARRCVDGADFASLDGFIVARGRYRCEDGQFDFSAGGMLNAYVSPTIANCIFYKNTASGPNEFSMVLGAAGAMANYEASPLIRKCIFLSNEGIDSAAGALLNYGWGYAVILDCAFIGNKNTTWGGGVYNYDSALAIVNTQFRGNQSGSGGGLSNWFADPVLLNCAFTDNQAIWDGGGLHNIFNSELELMNCTFARNSAPFGGCALSSQEYCRNIVSNCIFWDAVTENSSELYCGEESETVITYSCIRGGYAGEGNIDTDPMFVANGTCGSVQLRAGSPCIDAGSLTNAPENDLLYRLRPQGAGIDMGAYEGGVADNDIVTLTILPSGEGIESSIPPAGIHTYARGETAWVAGLDTESSFFHHWDEHDPTTYSISMNSDTAITPVFVGNICYVDASASSGAPDGCSWATAFSNIQTAVDATAVDGRNEIWVAEGAYTASTDAVLTMAAFSHVYGGFSGNETSLEQRDWAMHPTIIDGQNAHRCVEAADETVLDGLILRNGAGTIAEYDTTCGGGIYANDARMEIRNCSFQFNNAHMGSGIFAYKGNLTVENCSFLNNTGETYGGGLHACQVTLNVSKCSFVDNHASNGGGIWAGSENRLTTDISDCFFYSNTAKHWGGAICDMSYAATISNCIFYNNSAATGGSLDMGSIDAPGVASTIVHCTFVNGSAQQGMEIGSCYPKSNVKNCIFWNNYDVETPIIDSAWGQAIVSNCCVKGGYSGEGNINADPQFIDVAQADFRLKHSSPCINAGTNAGLPGSVAVDIAGTARPQGAGYDMGAYELIIEHSADFTGDNRIDLTELLRVVQLFNMGGYHCTQAGNPTEDGYLPGTGEEHGCAPHRGDYAPQNWRIDFSELLRLIQFFNVGGYHQCPDADTEDGFCPGREAG